MQSQNRSKSSRALFVASLTTVLGLTGTVASAATINWGGAATGKFNDPALWSGGVRPTTTDDAVVTLGGALTTITLTHDYTSVVPTPTAFDNATWRAEREFNPASLTFANTTPATSVSFQDTYLSGAASGNPATTQFKVAGAVTVGENMNITIVNGGGGGTRSFSAATFDIGSGSTMIVNPQLGQSNPTATIPVEKNGLGRLVIVNGNAATKPNMNVNAGVLEYRDVAQAPTGGGQTLNIGASGAVELQANAFRDYTFALTGTGTITSTGTRTARLAGNNTAFNGTMVINSGNLAFNSDNGFGVNKINNTANGTFGLEYTTTYNPNRLLNPTLGGLRVAGGTVAVPVVVNATDAAPLQLKKTTVVAQGTIDVTGMAGGLNITGGGNIRGGTATAGQTAQYAGNIVGDGSSTVSVGDDFATANIGTLTINGNLTLNANTGAGGGIALNVSATDMTMGGTINDLLQLNGNLITGSTPTVLRINSTGNPTPGNSYTVINGYTGSVPNLVAVPSGIRAPFTVDTSTPGQVKVVAGAAIAANLVWKGDLNAATWDLNVTQNFLNASAPDVFLNGDNVLFDDTSSNKTVTLFGGTLGAASLTVDTAATYTFLSGTTAGAIGATTGIVKKGVGTMALNGNWAGSTAATLFDIQQGKLDLGAGAATAPGVGGRTIQLAAGTEVLMNTTANYNFTAPVSGAGTVRKLQNAPATLNGASSAFTGLISVEAGTLTIGGIAALGTADNGISVINDAAVTLASGFNTQTVSDAITINSTNTAALKVAPATFVTIAAPITTTGAVSHVDIEGDSRITVNANIGGAGGLTLHGRTTRIDQGNLVVNGDMTLGGALTLDASSSLILTSAGSALSPHVVRAKGLTLTAPLTPADAATTLDIGNNAMAIDYTGTSPASAVNAAILEGLNGVFAGEVAMYTTDPTPARKIGYAEANGSAPALYGPVDGTTLLVRLTLAGDSNVDGIVNFDDLLALAQNYSGSGKLWYQGDFDYSGVVNFDDLLALAQNYNGALTLSEANALGSDFAADFALARSLVPEPTTLAASMLGLALVRRRR